jgi:hypothetical protein
MARFGLLTNIYDPASVRNLLITEQVMHLPALFCINCGITVYNRSTRLQQMIENHRQHANKAGAHL